MIQTDILLKAFRLMCTAQYMTDTYENNRAVCRYVHSTSRGHEAIQLAAAFQLLACDYLNPYYRDESLLLGIGFSPYQLMLQLLAKKEDVFSGGREYYCHPSFRGPHMPTIIHQSSATGMQAIPSTGIAQGLAFLEDSASPLLIKGPLGERPVVLCSLGDASITEGEVSEAFQFAVLQKLPVIFLVQDNGWGISASATETRAMDAFEYAAGFPGMDRTRVDGSDFEQSFAVMQAVFSSVREHRKPFLVQASVPLLGHHTSGVRREFYRSQEDLSLHALRDPLPLLKERLKQRGIPLEELDEYELHARAAVDIAFRQAAAAEEPAPEEVEEFVFAPTAITQEKGERVPPGAAKVLMVDAALAAIGEIMEAFPESILFGQDVGKRLGGVFRETSGLAERFGERRVFNTAIQEAYIIGSTAGLCATGVKPIVEVQFADYIYPGFNQLVTEISKSAYLSRGKFPIQTLIRIPVGAYGGGGPYHSGSIESTLLSIKGIKVAYPSNAADMKGLMKAAFLDPNPVIMLEHKGLYWSKLPGTESAKSTEPSADYILPLGKACQVLEADSGWLEQGESCCIITYGMGVYWAREAARELPGQLEIIDLRTLYPLDEALVFESVKRHGKCLVLTEEPQNNSFGEALASRISRHCFSWLDAPVEVLGALNLPAVPLNIRLEKAMLPSGEKVLARVRELLSY